MQTWTYNEYDSLTSKHEIVLDRLTWLKYVNIYKAYYYHLMKCFRSRLSFSLLWKPLVPSIFSISVQKQTWTLYRYLSCYETCPNWLADICKSNLNGSQPRTAVFIFLHSHFSEWVQKFCFLSIVFANKFLHWEYLFMVWFCCVLWHSNPCGLLGYLMPNHIYIKHI